MALTMKQASVIVSALGLISFVFGVIAENTKVHSPLLITASAEPTRDRATYRMWRIVDGLIWLLQPPSGTPIPGKDVVICKYPADPSVYMGYISIIFLVGATVMGYLSLFYPYSGKSVPCSALFESNILFVFFNISL